MVESILIAVGGNAIIKPGEEGTLKQQYDNTRETMREIGELIQAGNPRLVITHGNGPQVGNIVFRSEVASTQIFPLTLDVCVSDSEGGMGYMIQQVLHNELASRSLERDVVTLITQVEVDPADAGFRTPEKFIGRAYTREEAETLSQTRSWVMKDDVGRGWRRVVPSPHPVRIIEEQIVRVLLEAGVIVIAAGGGGIPVVVSPKQEFFGVEAVVDKDLVSALLAIHCEIETLCILTGVEHVYVNYRQPGERALGTVSMSELRRYYNDGHFPPGSMGPKIEASLMFLEAGGRRVVITSPGNVIAGLKGERGTVILP